MTTKIQTFGGNIGIGTTDPGDFKLNVNGSLKTSSLVVNGVTDAQVPIGLLGMWSGSLGSIPSGWALCDGNSHTRTDGVGSIATPNLTNRFIRGAYGNVAPSPVVVGSTGGSNNVSLSAANLAPHNHGVTVVAGNANHDHNTAESNMAHAHPVGDTQTPHNHGETGTTNTPHNHGTSGGKSPSPHSHSATQANMPHSHNTETNDSPHAHLVTTINNRTSTAGAQVNATRTLITSETFGANAGGPHTHTGFQTTPAHAHDCPTTDVPHTHNTGGDNWTHGHSLNTVNANHSHQTGSGSAAHSHTVSDADASHGHSASSSNTGQGTPFSVINTYYALFYIMKI
jgi:hypothetical protein